MNWQNIVLIVCCVFGPIALIASVVKHRRIQRQLREEKARSAKASAEFWAEMNRKNAAHAERIYGEAGAQDRHTRHAMQSRVEKNTFSEPLKRNETSPVDDYMANPLNPLHPLNAMYQPHSYTAPEPSSHCAPSHSSHSSHDHGSSSHGCSGSSYDSGSSSSSSSSDCGSSSSSCD